MVSAGESYPSLVIGDGFDHVCRRVEIDPALMYLEHDATALLQPGFRALSGVKVVKMVKVVKA